MISGRVCMVIITHYKWNFVDTINEVTVETKKRLNDIFCCEVGVDTGLLGLTSASEIIAQNQGGASKDHWVDNDRIV